MRQHTVSNAYRAWRTKQQALHQVEPPLLDDERSGDPWYDSYPVQQALKQAGPLQLNNPSWFADFAEALIDAADRTADIDSGDAQEAQESADTWHRALEAAGNPKELPQNFWARKHLRRLLDIMPIDAVARYLTDSAPSIEQRPDVRQVERWLFPKLASDDRLDRAHKAKQMVLDGVPPKTAAARVGICYGNGLLPFLKAHRVEAVVVGIDGRRKMPASIRERIAELGAQGLTAKVVMDTVNAENPGLDIKYDAVKQALRRARRAA